jgi:hypothetical protein
MALHFLNAVICDTTDDFHTFPQFGPRLGQFQEQVASVHYCSELVDAVVRCYASRLMPVARLAHSQEPPGRARAF